MADYNLIINNVYIYLFFLLLSLYYLYNYQKDFNFKDLINSFIYLTNKIFLLLFFILMLFASIFSLINHDINLINNFIKEIIKGLIYYIFFNYLVFYGIKLIYWTKDFFKETDMFGISYIDKNKILGGKKK
jgi:hypothetical protein